MIILYIETATDICSVAISKNRQLLSLKETTEPFVHSKKITMLIHEVLAIVGISLSAIDVVALSQGPGSYTGLRVGASTAKGICYALDKPLIAVDTLAALANNASISYNDKEAMYCPMIDARRKEVYTALYDAKGGIIEQLNNKVLDKDSFKEYFNRNQKIVFTGNGSKKASTIIESPFAIFFDGECSAKNLINLAVHAYENRLFADPVYFEPKYYKTPNITTPKKLL